MIVPANRLLLLAACVLAPAITLAWSVPATAPVLLAAGALAVAAALWDAHYALRRAHGIQVQVPEALRWTKDCEARFSANLVPIDQSQHHLRIVAAFPPGIHCATPMQEATLQSSPVTLTWTCLPQQRGRFALRGIEWEQTSPAKLWHVRNSVQPACELRVYPNLRDPQTRSLLLSSQSGLHQHRQIGKGREFERLREYVAGDAYDDISWKPTARRGRPIIAVSRIERMQQVYIVMDTSRLAAREGALDAYISAALTLSIACQKEGDQFGLLTFNDRVSQFVRAGSGTKHFGVLRETLYDVTASRVAPDFSEVFTFIQRMLRRRALLVFLTFLDDAALAEEFVRDLPLLARRHLVVVHVAAAEEARPAFTGPEPTTEGALYERLAGQIVFSLLQEAARKAERAGAGFTVLQNERALSQVVASYKELKRRQAL